jgi:hypothetical protein
VIQATNIGYDSNPLNFATDANPTSDFTTIFKPVLEGWLRVPHARVSARTEFDFYYFNNLADYKAVDNDSYVRVEVPINRVTPYFDGALTNTRFPPMLEINTVALRRITSQAVGVSVRLTEKIFVGGQERHASVEYEPNSLYLGTDLSRQLNYHSTGETIEVRYAATPLTTVYLEVQQERDRFDRALGRDADSLTISPVVQFAPRALITGRASIGYHRQEFLVGTQKYEGTVFNADLNYTLLSSTQFSVRANRELRYSYQPGQNQYVATEVTPSVIHRFGGSWDAGGSYGRARVHYLQNQAVLNPVTDNSDESYWVWTVDLGHTMRKIRVAFHMEHREGIPDVPAPFRAVERFFVGSSVTYKF